MSRIDDRSNTDNTISDRIIEDSRKDQTKKTNRAEFEKKMALQKEVEGRTPLPDAAKSEFARKAIQQFQEQPSGKASLKEERPTSKAPAKNSTLGKAKSKEATKKDDLKKEDTKSAKAEKKHEDVALSIAVRQKQDKQDDDGFSEKGSDEFFQAAANIAAQPLVKTNEAQKAAPPARIPDEILHQLVDRIFVGIDAKGLNQFVIELKDGVLGGGQISVSAQGGKINLKFSGLDEDSKKLVSNSKQELRARLLSKNLSLDSFEVI